MKIILDTNIIISALIKNSITRKIIIQSEWGFYYPEIGFKEIQKYEDMIIEKSGIKKKEYLTLMQKLFRYIEIIPENKTSLNIEKASKIIGHIDPKDVIFVATKLCVKNSIIWSDDNDFDKQNKVKFIKTKGIIEIFKYLERCDYT